ADIKSDIYSLGCTLYHMLTGQVPFPSPSLPEKLFAHQAMEPTPLEQLVPGLPEGLGGVVRTMMRKQPEERDATPTVVVAALARCVEDSVTGVRAERSKRWSAEGGPRSGSGSQSTSGDEPGRTPTAGSGSEQVEALPEGERVLAATAAASSRAATAVA